MLGGSVSGGHGIGNLGSGESQSPVYINLTHPFRKVEPDASLNSIALPIFFVDKIWVVKTFNAINEAYPHPDNSLRNAAVGAVGSEYFVSEPFRVVLEVETSS